MSWIVTAVVGGGLLGSALGSRGGGGNTTINAAPQQGYGEALSDALKAQTDLLRGTGEFQDTGGLQSLLEEYEAPLRESTAQIDTDILRKTLLGTTTGGGEQEVTYDDQGRVIRGYKEAPKYEVRQRIFQQTYDEDGDIDYGAGVSEVDSNDRNNVFNRNSYRDGSGNVKPPSGYFRFELVNPDGDVVAFAQEDFSVTEPTPITATTTRSIIDIDASYDAVVQELFANMEDNEDVPADLLTDLRNNYETGESLSGLDDKNSPVSISEGEGSPIYLTDENGEIIQDPEKAGMTETRVIPEQRAEDGMIDLLGDKQLTADGRKPGFDAEGNFLGLSALAEDVQAGNLSRQRERDLADVENLQERYKTIMDQFKPGTAQGIEGAQSVLESQRQRLTGQRPATAEDVASGLATEVGEMIQGDGTLINAPAGSTYGGDVTGATMTAATVGATPGLTAATSYDALDPLTQATLSAGTSFDAATAADPMALTAATSYDPSAAVVGRGYDPSADIAGGALGGALATGDGTLRSDIITQAQEALGQGLTDREERQIAEAARARSTMMGRTFDQSAAIQEAEARVLEDNQRRMQNRAFAQQVLGQEAGLQESDLGRSLQAQLANQAALNRAAEFGAGQDIQAQLANQAATNQALQAGLSAGLSQEALAAQQAQAKALADQSAVNRAREFGVTAGMGQEEAQARMRQQAEMADLQAEQRRQEAGLQAGMEQDVLAAQLGQQANLAQAQMDQQAAAFGAESAQQAALANQRQAQQAEQFGVGATMDAERLDAQLKQSGALGYVDAATRLAALEDQYTLDPFAAILNRAGGGSLQAGQSVLGQANYGLTSGPQYLNPESGLGYISQMAANEANMYGAQLAADASRSSGLMGGLGAIGGGLLSNAALFCWVAREVYGPTNPAWMQFRKWMFTESPQWFFDLYRKYGEQFAQWISDKPRIKSIIRKWMDSKIGDK
jgi:hypothetical protein